LSDISAFIEQFQTAVDFQEPVDITSETLLADLPEWDSLAALGVIVMFDMEHNKTITGNDLKNCKSIADLFALLG
jgi:acyl carrier protein